MPFPIAAVVAAAASIIGSALAARENRRNTDRTIESNKQLAEYQYSRDVEMMNNQRRYDDPSQQMSRMMMAGLNPNMIYGSGSVAGNTSGQLPKYNAPTTEYNYSPAVDIPAALGAYQNYQLQQAQIDNVRAQTANVNARTLTEGFRSTLTDVQGQRTAEQARHEQYIHPYQAAVVGNQARASEAKLRQEWERLSLMSKDQVLKDLESDQRRKSMTAVDLDNEKRRADILFMKYRNEWIKQGVTTSDNPLLRILVRMMSQSGFDPVGAVANPLKQKFDQHSGAKY